MKLNKAALREQIKRIVEELGHAHVRGGKGYGASQPYYDHSDRIHLGPVYSPKPEKPKVSGPVQVSRAFRKSDEELD
jgi:hypothetical protein|tara:strand:+ start:3926 stop:4156 length:231 start_codon:yes stop_codon:yes gene_type:complete